MLGRYPSCCRSPIPGSLSVSPETVRRGGKLFLVLLAGVVASWVVYLPSLASPSSEILASSSKREATTMTVDRLAKADRLIVEGSQLRTTAAGKNDAASFRDRFVIEIAPAKSQPSGNLQRRIPAGCESAFGGIVKSANVTASRCVTSIERPVTVASLN